MKRVLQKTAILALVLATGCVQALTGAKTGVEPLARDFDSMPVEAATIVSAMAVQTLTPPLEEFGSVSFAPGVQGLSETGLAREGFGFTGATLFAFSESSANRPGLTAAEIEYTDALDRRATFLARAEYRRAGNGYEVTRLEVQRSYADAPKVRVFVVPAADIPAKSIGSHAQLTALLADKALSPADYKNASRRAYAVFAVGRDWVAPGAELDIAISAKKAGRSGYDKATKSYMVNGWPVAVTVGEIDPRKASEALYAKVLFRKGSGFGAVSQHVGTYQLAGFGK